MRNENVACGPSLSTDHRSDLGLFGSGGSILTVPVLVCVLGHDDKTAIAESLAIVGAIALMVVMPSVRVRQVDWSTSAIFVVVGIVRSRIGRHLGSLHNLDSLRRAFAVFLVAMGRFVLIRAAPRVIEAVGSERVTAVRHPDQSLLSLPASSLCAC